MADGVLAAVMKCVPTVRFSSLIVRIADEFCRTPLLRSGPCHRRSRRIWFRQPGSPLWLMAETHIPVSRSSDACQQEDDISEQNFEVRVTALEAHAFRTNCRLRDLEGLVAELVGAGTDSPTGAAARPTVDQRLDRIEEALEKLRRWKTILPKLEYESARTAAAADRLTVTEWVSRAIVEKARQEAIRDGQRGGARMEAIPIAPAVHRILTVQADAEMVKPWALAARYIRDGVEATAARTATTDADPSA